MSATECHPATELVVIEACRSAVGYCPNMLIPTADWQRAVEEWSREHEVSARLRRRINGEKILHHQKLHITIAGCPNACSRPQIADVGLVGFVRPAVEAATCVTCGACETACPDTAITVDGRPPVFDTSACQGCMRCRTVCPVSCINLSSPGVRILLGGKLGRHPRLAEVAGEVVECSQVLELLTRIVETYLEHAEPEERIADFLFRTRTKLEVPAHG